MSLAGAFVLGALHVLEPAHGRSLITALAVGATNRRGGVLLYGLVVTAAHTFTTLLIAIAVTIFGTRTQTGSVAIYARFCGAVLTTYFAYKMLRHAAEQEKCRCALHHSHAPHNGVAAHPVGLGLAGGLIPCYGSLALVVAAIGTGQFGGAVPLVLVFGAGLGVTLVVSALLSQQITRLFARERKTPLAYSGYVAGGIVGLAGIAGLVWTVWEIVARA
jgi:ABC-type nickel/cobalt efflux system permease component RcnA